MRLRLRCAGLVWLCLAAAPAGAAAQDCLPDGGYPGDEAGKQAVATWMARGAVAREIPAELPVMGALVESGLKNLSYGDADTAGYFQMRKGIWNQGDYAGFPDNPELQLDWFLDYARAEREQEIAAGDADFGRDPDGWGAWIADVLRPPEQYRGRYQLRLDEARGLILPRCEGDPPSQGPGGGMVVGDVAPPGLTLPATAFRRAALALRVACAGEPCTVTVRARVNVPSGAARVYRLRAEPVALPAGGSTRVSLPFQRRLRRAIARSLARGRTVRARLRVQAVDAAGNPTVLRRAVRLG